MPRPPRSTNRIETDDARAGSKEGVVRWVLGISLALTVIAFAVIVVTNAWLQDPVESQQNAERRVIEERKLASPGNDSSIDGVVADDPEAGAPKTSQDQ